MDAAPATSGSLGFPISLAFDGRGNLFFYDNTSSQPPPTGSLRRITARTVADGSPLPLDGSEPLTTIKTTNFIAAMAFDRHGNLFLANAVFGVNKMIARRAGDGSALPIDGSEETVTVAGLGTNAPSDGLAARDVRIRFASGLMFDAAGNLYVSDGMGNRVLKIAAGPGPIDGTEPISTVAGTGALGFSGDGFPARLATFQWPSGVLPGPNIVITDGENHRIRRLNLQAAVDVQPRELPVSSRGRWVTATIHFTDESAAGRAALVRTVELQRIDASGAVRDRLPAAQITAEDVDGDGVAEAIVKFGRAGVQAWGVAGAQLRVRVEGRFAPAAGAAAGELFSGEATVVLVE